MEIKWRVPYMKGDKPLNMDDTPHQCTQQQIPQNTPPAPVVPVDRTAVITEIKEFLLAFPVPDNQSGRFTPDQLDVASRIYISRTMKR